MSFYSQRIFPWLCDFALDQENVRKHRRELLAKASGDILEIGFGTGLNLRHYPPHVRKITIVDPNIGMNRRAQKRIRDGGIEVDQRLLSSERLPFEHDAFDSVVSSFTLCSIENVAQALSEICRVLKPGGTFLFLEHGLSPEPKVRKWQHRLNRLQMLLAAGCHLDRNIRELIGAEPFSSIEIDNFYLEQIPKPHGYMYGGVAIK